MTTGTPRRSPRAWTASEDAVVVARYQSDGPAGLARELGRPRCSVRSRAVRLGVTRTGLAPDELRALKLANFQRALTARGNHRWSAADDAAVRAWWQDHADRPLALADLAARLGATENALRARAALLGLRHGAYRPRTHWTDEMDTLLRQWAGLAPAEVIAGQLGVTTSAVQVRSKRLGLVSADNRRARLGDLYAVADRLRLLLAYTRDLAPLAEVAAALDLTPEQVIAAARREAVAGARLVGARERRAVTAASVPVEAPERNTPGLCVASSRASHEALQARDRRTA